MESSARREAEDEANVQVAPPLNPQQLERLNNRRSTYGLFYNHIWKHMILGPSIGATIITESYEETVPANPAPSENTYGNAISEQPTVGISVSYTENKTAAEIPSTDNAESSQNTAVSSQTRTVTRKFFQLEHLKLIDFIHLGQSSRFFHLLIREPNIQNRMRALASNLPFPAPNILGQNHSLESFTLRGEYLASRRVEHLIKNGQLTLNQAMSRVPLNTLAALYSNWDNSRITAVQHGVEPSETRFDWFSPVHSDAIAIGIPIEEIKFLTEYQVSAILVTFSADHIEAIKANIAYTEIKGLTNYQAQAILATRDENNKPTLTRADVSNLKSEEPQTAEKKTLSEAPAIAALTREDVLNVNLKLIHINGLKKGLSFERVKKSSALQLEAFFAGFSEPDAEAPWLSEEHCRLVNSKTFTIEEIRGLSLDQLQALHKGHRREAIEQLDIIQLKILLTGLVTLEEITKPAILEWLPKVQSYASLENVLKFLLANGHKLEIIMTLNIKQLTLIYLYNSSLLEVTKPSCVKLLEENAAYVIGRMLQKGLPLEKLGKLNTKQIALLGGDYDCTLEQVENPICIKLLEKNTAKIIGSMLKQGNSLEIIERLNAKQLKLISTYSCTFQQVTDPICIELIKESKTVNDLHWIGTLLQRGFPLSQLKGLTTNQLELMVNYSCPLEQVINPSCIALLEKNKGDIDFLSTLGSVLQQYSLDQLKDLNRIQIKALSQNYTIEQVTNPILMRLCEKYGQKFAYAIERLLKKGADPKELEELTPLQWQALGSEELDLTLTQVKHPNFSRPLLYALAERTHTFAELINLEEWQLGLIENGVSFEEVIKPNPGMTGLHSIAVSAARFPYPKIRDLSGTQLMTLLATPYNQLPWAQKPQGENALPPSGSSFTHSSSTPAASEGPTIFHAWRDVQHGTQPPVVYSPSSSSSRSFSSNSNVD